ncbi:MAG TPA: hypothetical protein VF642_03005 [Propionibacteriaceae bacterium]|jgi:hypothetical protein
MLAVPKKLREPVTVVLLIVLVLRLVLAVVELVRSVQDLNGDGPTGMVSGDPVGASAAAVLFFSSTDVLNVVVLALLVGACALWSPIPRAPQLTLAALLVTAALVAVSAIDLVVMVLARQGSPGLWTAALSAGLALVLPVLVLVVLAQLRRGLARDRDERRREIAAGPDQAATPALDARAEPEPDPEHQPVWQPDQAAGAAWLTAGEAASGAAASRWGSPGDSSGWQPQPSGVVPPTSPSPSTPTSAHPTPTSGHSASTWPQPAPAAPRPTSPAARSGEADEPANP